jgi:iron(III) transport system ATP-binding protein
MIEVENLKLTYRTRGEPNPVVRGISFHVERGQFYTLLGPSGCGKTTTLRCLAGLEHPDDGVIRIDGQVVASPATGEWVPGNRRAIGMVFQSYAIWPHLSVFENVAFPLRYGDNRVSRTEIERRVKHALELVKLVGLENRPAPHLSGGQQQRLALARAFVMEPKVLLLDEPLSNLDAKLREEMRGELRHLVKSLGITTVFVTHEQIEALTLSDTIAVMRDGVIVQEGSPRQIYDHPKNPFVADFIGGANLVSGTVANVAGDLVKVECPLGTLACTAVDPLKPGDPVTVAVRPEQVHLESEAGVHVPGGFHAVVESSRFIGSGVEVTLEAGSQRVKATSSASDSYNRGMAVTASVGHCVAFSNAK